MLKLINFFVIRNYSFCTIDSQAHTQSEREREREEAFKEAF